MSKEETPMTTHVSRERREAVMFAIGPRLYDNGGHKLTDEEWDAALPALADAAIAALAPDRAAFDNALTELVACAMEWGVHEGEGRITADEQERLTNNAADVVRALVYGDDDAQAGEVE